MSSTLAELRANTLDRGQAYRDLCRAIARDEQRPTDEVTQILANAQKTEEELTRDVGLHQYRQRLRNTLAESAAQQKRLKELRGEIEKHNAVLEAAVSQHQADTRPIQIEIAEINQQVHQAAQIPTELYKGCTDSTLLARRQSITNESQVVQKAINDANGRLERMQGNPAAMKRISQELATLRGRASMLTQKLDATIEEMRAW